MRSSSRWLVFMAVALVVVVVGVVALSGGSEVRDPDGPTPSTRAPTRSSETRETPRAPTRTKETPVAPIVLKPGRVHGWVRDALGAPKPGVAVALVGSAAKPIDQAKSQNDGSFELTDIGLDANGITVNGERRELLPLDPGEDRELVLVIGETREVIGWVLDLAGDPLPGAWVTLTADASAGRWTTFTDGDGEFRFTHAPPTDLRVVADALDLGTASARLVASDEKRREVTLVLEPSATLIVHAAPGITGTVLVRSYDPAAHGEDGSYAGGNEHVLMDALDKALRLYDAVDSRGSFARVLRTIAESSGEFADELRQNAIAMDPTLEGAPLDDMIAPAMDYLLETEPDILVQLDVASRELRNGASIMDALALSEDARRAAGEARDNEEPPAPRSNPSDVAIERVKATTGVSNVGRRRDDRMVVARGAIDSEIVLRGALEYSVTIAMNGAEIECGTFVIDIGDVVEITCGKSGETAITGRVVDVRGQPLGNLPIESYIDGALVTTETDARGRFVLRGNVSSVVALSVTIGSGPVEGPQAERFNVAARPGGTTDLGLIVARRPTERATVYPTSPYGSVVVESTLVRTNRGFDFTTVDPMSPVGLEGIEDQAALIAIDEVDATHLGMDDVLAALRGDPGSDVALRVRSREGELFDVIVKRALVETPKAVIGPE